MLGSGVCGLVLKEWKSRADGVRQSTAERELFPRHARRG